MWKQYLASNTSYIHKDDLLEVTGVSVSVDGSWGSREFLLCQGLICLEDTGKVVVILKTNYFKTCSNIKAQKDTGSINLLQ